MPSSLLLDEIEDGSGESLSKATAGRVGRSGYEKTPLSPSLTLEDLHELLKAQGKQLRLLKERQLEKDDGLKESAALLEKQYQERGCDEEAGSMHEERMPESFHICEMSLPKDSYSYMVISPIGSLQWRAGIFVWVFQVGMYFLLINDQFLAEFVQGSQEPNHIMLNVPVVVSPFVSIAQLFALIITNLMQDDMYVSARTLSRFMDEKVWDEFYAKIKILPQYVQGNNQSISKSWWKFIGLPYILKAFQGLLGFLVSVAIILQNASIINLFKDFTALVFIGEIDELVFNLSLMNHFGRKIRVSSQQVNETLIPGRKEPPNGRMPLYRRLQIFFFLFILGMWVLVTTRQRRGRYIKIKYPHCQFVKNSFREWRKLGNNHCDTKYNNPSCRFDGGDCDEFNAEYPNCFNASYPEKVGNGRCDPEYNNTACRFDGYDCFNQWFEKDCDVLGLDLELLGDGICHGKDYNKLACAYDAGDCIEFNLKYPKCEVKNPHMVGNGICDYDNSLLPQLKNMLFVENIIQDSSRYASAPCGFDGGDCLSNLFPHCDVEHPDWLGNGKCTFNGPYNTEACGWDGGDCIKQNFLYPKCNTESLDILFSNQCTINSDRNSPECNYDGGYCVSKDKFPHCNATSPPLMSRGFCKPECGYSLDNSNCTNFYKIYPYCNATDLSLIGNGVCDHSEFNTMECGYEDHDCVNVTLDCKVTNISLIGNGVCNGGFQSPYISKECGWDGGDCIEAHAKNLFCNATDPEKIGDGMCHGGEYNTRECEWDGGDCIEFNIKYPDCSTAFPSNIGDGKCWTLYNTEACKWDGGDCTEFNEMYPNCTSINYPWWLGDGICDGTGYNSEECGFDGGDCKEFNKMYPDCNVPGAYNVLDGVCDGGVYNTIECNWDGGACVEFNTNYPKCNVTSPRKVSDGTCDGNGYNTTECGYDGGDCL